MRISFSRNSDSERASLPSITYKPQKNGIGDVRDEVLQKKIQGGTRSNCFITLLITIFNFIKYTLLGCFFKKRSAEPLGNALLQENLHFLTPQLPENTASAVVEPEAPKEAPPSPIRKSGISAFVIDDIILTRSIFQSSGREAALAKIATIRENFEKNLNNSIKDFNKKLAKVRKKVRKKVRNLMQKSAKANDIAYKIFKTKISLIRLYNIIRDFHYYCPLVDVRPLPEGILPLLTFEEFGQLKEQNRAIFCKEAQHRKALIADFEKRFKVTYAEALKPSQCFEEPIENILARI